MHYLIASLLALYTGKVASSPSRFPFEDLAKRDYASTHVGVLPNNDNRGYNITGYDDVNKVRLNLAMDWISCTGIPSDTPMGVLKRYDGATQNVTATEISRDIIDAQGPTSPRRYEKLRDYVVQRIDETRRSLDEMIDQLLCPTSYPITQFPAGGYPVPDPPPTVTAPAMTQPSSPGGAADTQWYPLSNELRRRILQDDDGSDYGDVEMGIMRSTTLPNSATTATSSGAPSASASGLIPSQRDRDLSAILWVPSGVTGIVVAGGVMLQETTGDHTVETRGISILTFATFFSVLLTTAWNILERRDVLNVLEAATGLTYAATGGRLLELLRTAWQNRNTASTSASVSATAVPTTTTGVDAGRGTGSDGGGNAAAAGQTDPEMQEWGQCAPMDEVI